MGKAQRRARNGETQADEAQQGGFDRGGGTPPSLHGHTQCTIPTPPLNAPAKTLKAAGVVSWQWSQYVAAKRLGQDRAQEEHPKT